MEVTQRIQPIQDEACQLFTEIEGQGAKLEEVVIAVEQRLEGPVNEAVIQEFVEQEVMAQQQVEAAQAKLFEVRATQTKVTRDESQVSVGGMLALDQVLRILGHV
jgi:hypothetical protein